MAMRHGWSTVAVFEDDFVWNEHTDPTLVQGIIRQIIATVGNWDRVIARAELLLSRAMCADTSKSAPPDFRRRLKKAGSNSLIRFMNGPQFRA